MHHATSLTDARRLAAVAMLTPEQAAHEELDLLTAFAVRVLAVPSAAVTLLDATEQHYVSHVGLSEPLARARRTRVGDSFCRYVVMSGRPFTTSDALRDPFFLGNPLVLDHGMRAYAGVPIRTRDGHVIGAFCAIDREPRMWTTADLKTLLDLGRLAARSFADRHFLASGEEVA